MLLLAIDFDNLHQILQNLYVEMMPLCSKMTGVARGLAGLGALFYVAYRVWQAPVSYTHLDVYKRQGYDCIRFTHHVFIPAKVAALVVILGNHDHPVHPCLLYTSRCV